MLFVIILHGDLRLLSLSRSVLHPIVESYMTREIRNVVSKFCVRVRRCKHLKKDGEERDEALARADISTPNVSNIA